MTEYRSNAAKTAALCGVLTALAMCLSLADTWISAFIPFLPGMKLGLANIVTLYALYRLGVGSAALITAIRCVLTGLLSGFVTMIAFSLAGGFLSLLIMAVLKKRLSVIKVSVCGGIAHNMAQITVAVLLTSSAAAYYTPALIVAGCVSGFAMGIIALLLPGKLSVKKATPLPK